MTEPSVSEEVKQFYRSNPYPAYGTAAKTKAANVYAKYCTTPGKYLEAGCGTGHVVAGSAVTLPLDFEFDYISCLSVLYHLENPEQGLANLADKLAVGGFLFMHVYGEDYHRRRFQTVEWN